MLLHKNDKNVVVTITKSADLEDNNLEKPVSIGEEDQ